MSALRGCPECRSKEVDWYEHSEMRIHFTQTSDGIEEDGYPDTPNPLKVTGECRDCGHCWTVRGAFQITDLPGHSESRTTLGAVWK